MTSSELTMYQCRIYKTLLMLHEMAPDARLSDIIDAIPDILIYLSQPSIAEKRIEEAGQACIDRLISTYAIPAWVA